jgi:hypothetical protein
MKTQSAKTAPDPFALMMDPQSVLAAIECSERLQGLSRHVYRPLDKPLIPRVGNDIDAFDQQVDSDTVSGLTIDDTLSWGGQ